MIRRWMATTLATLLFVAGCSGSPTGSDGQSPTQSASPGWQAQPPSGVSVADDAAAVFVKALAALDISNVPMQSTAASAQEELTLLFAGMDGIKPQVTAGTISYKAEDRSAEIPLTITLNVGKEPWTYQSKATMKWVDEQWRLEWSPSIVHEKLNESSRMRRIVTNPKRAAINDREGLALVEEVTVIQVGIDKSSLDQSKWDSSARKLATLLQQDPTKYAQQVASGGSKQFVIAATLRQANVPPEVADVPGVLLVEQQRSEGPSDGFAASILGSVGSPTAEMIEKSEGQLTTNDVVGLNGLQSRYNDQLGGVPGVRVEVVPRKDAEEFDPIVIFNQEESVGAPITLSLDRNLQQKAEDALAGQSGIASIVAIDLESGGILVAANSPKAGTYPYATFGKYAPGSTFKIASALAMIRKGKNASSTVTCSSTYTVSGYTFKNYSGYSHTGKIPLSDAIAYSCNTVFTRAATEVSGEELHQAAGSLGVGTDYDAGYTSYFGTVDPQNDIDRAASMIGQGQVTMSPLAMAAVAASVGKGSTVIPWLVEGHEPKSTATALTEEEAKQLRTMMEATVDHGTGTMLAGLVKGAKSGTAEWGPTGDQKTHAWMIAYTDKYAVAAFVEEGASGGGAAAPLIKALLS